MTSQKRNGDRSPTFQANCAVVCSSVETMATRLAAAFRRAMDAMSSCVVDFVLRALTRIGRRNKNRLTSDRPLSAAKWAMMIGRHRRRMTQGHMPCRACRASATSESSSETQNGMPTISTGA